MAGLALSWAALQRLDDDRDNQFGSVNTRVVTYDAAMTLWREDPLVGVGIKYWRDPDYVSRTGFGEPHSVVISTAGESGLVGLSALAVLLGGAGTLAWRRTGALWFAVVLLLVARFTESLLSIFWVANSGSFPWIILGLAIGDAARRADTSRGG